MPIQESNMRKETATPPVKDGMKASEVAQPIGDKNVPAAAKAEPSETRNVATTAAVKKVAPKPQADKKIVAKRPTTKEVPEKPTATAKAPAKSVKKAPTIAKTKITENSKEEKLVKVSKQVSKKPKLVRDSFTIPESDYALFATLKQRALTAGIEVKKSELLRASLTILAGLDDGSLAKAIGQVNRIKTGRPKK